MPYLRVWIHFVWATKNRVPFLTEDIRQTVFSHIKQNAVKKDIYLDCVNGHKEYVHCLVSLGVDQAIAKLYN